MCSRFNRTSPSVTARDNIVSFPLTHRSGYAVWTSSSIRLFPAFERYFDPDDSLPIETRGVGHPLSDEVEPRALLGGPNACSWDIERPDGVTSGLHVRRYAVEPSVAVRSRNLLANDDCRAADIDEPVPVGPEIPGIFVSALLSCAAVGLARAASGPDAEIVWPSSQLKSVGPYADASEEMALIEAPDFLRTNFLDGTRVDFTGGNSSSCDEPADPVGGKRIEFVVVDTRHTRPRSELESGGHRLAETVLFVESGFDPGALHHCPGLGTDQDVPGRSLGMHDEDEVSRILAAPSARSQARYLLFHRRSAIHSSSRNWRLPDSPKSPIATASSSGTAASTAPKARSSTIPSASSA